MSAKELLHWYLDQCPLVAIIRGITPDEADAIGDIIDQIQKGIDENKQELENLGF